MKRKFIYVLLFITLEKVVFRDICFNRVTFSLIFKQKKISEKEKTIEEIIMVI